MKMMRRPYKCTVQLALPSNQYAQHLKDVISVDKEISDKVVKSFSIVKVLPIEKVVDGVVEGQQEGGSDGVGVEQEGGGDLRVLQM